jgi:Zn-finger nucleic acid-binding protein
VPIHIPPSMSTHHPLTSPMGLPGPKAMWSPHQRGMGPPMASPHHLSPMDITQSKRKCVPLKPPIPSKFQGDMEKFKAATVPEFTSLVNFPVHMSQKQAVNLPEGMRCCVMCGSACPCSSGNKKKANGSLGGKKDSRGANGQDISGDKNGYAIIPTQNKGLCTLCDVNVWVVANSGLEIKWCKGCKNFRPWGAFGDKGLATKCLRCRERQREKYALQKEEKEKARLQKSAKAKA